MRWGGPLEPENTCYKKATSLQIHDPRLKHDTTATAATRAVRTMRLAVHSRNGGPSDEHGWATARVITRTVRLTVHSRIDGLSAERHQWPGLLLLETKKNLSVRVGGGENRSALVRLPVGVVVGVLVGVVIEALVGVPVGALVGVIVGVIVSLLIGVIIGVIVGVVGDLVGDLFGAVVSVPVGVLVDALIGGPSARRGSSLDLLFLEMKKKETQFQKPQGRKAKRTLLYLRISRTRLLKASSTLIRCLADVSTSLHPRSLASSRPSAAITVSKCRSVIDRGGCEGRRGVHTVHANLALILQIALISNQDDRETILVLHS